MAPLPGGHRSQRGRSGGRLGVSDRAGGPAITVQARIEGVARTSAEFRAARRQFNSSMRDVIHAAGKTVVLPRIKTTFTRDTGRMARSLYVKRDRTTVYIGSRLRGRENRAVGWIDFGGKRTRDRYRRTGPTVIVDTLHSRRRVIDEAILRGLMKTFDPLEHTP